MKDASRDRPPARSGEPSRKPGHRTPVLLLLVGLLGLIVLMEATRQRPDRQIPYSQFKQLVADRRISTVEIQADRIAGFALTDEAVDSGITIEQVREPLAGSAADQSMRPQVEYFETARIEDDELLSELQASGVRFGGVIPSFWSKAAPWLVPIGLIFLLIFLLNRRVSGLGGRIMSVGRSQAKLVGEQDTGVTFADVAGCDESRNELEEVVDFLKHPDRYQQLGARIPRGVLLVGPPGTGKTLLAKAVAGEAGVPFFQLSGSDFVEMFVGVGAARVRDLFRQAREKSPCIVFIDEIDAIGRSRSLSAAPGGNDEREQTLNQLLVEMDGFDSDTKVILLAATNRPEVLDRAILRPGRFDRQITVDLPDLDGREAILKVHSAGKRLATDASLHIIARGTAGFSGADLANVVNESALLAARRGGRRIENADLEEAVERVIAGPERRGRRLDPEEKRRVAFHEAGHALVIAACEYGDPVHKISIVPRGQAALGYTMQIPDDQQFLKTEGELFDRLKGLLGGRAAEEIVFGQVSTGAQNDLERATDLARQMICRFGMGKSAGLMSCAARESASLHAGSAMHNDCSEATAREIDHEVMQLLERGYRDARQILLEQEVRLHMVADRLLEVEVLDAADFEALLADSPESPDAVEESTPSMQRH